VRLATLRLRIQRGVEPTRSAFALARREADAQIDRQPHAPAVWYVPGRYRDEQGHRTAKASLENDANSAYTLALCFRLTDDERYADTAVRLIDGWATGVQTLRREDDSRLSFSYHFPALIFAADLLGGYAGWPPARRDAFIEFVSERALPMNTMERANNWGNWGLVLVMAAACFLRSADLLTMATARWKEFIETQIADDGHLPHEVGRNNGVGERGLWYSHFTLMPQTLAAEIGRVNGINLYEFRSPSGRTLRMAFERLAPWARRPETFPYFRGGPGVSLLGFDYISYYEILNAHWPNADASAMVQQMRPLSATHCTPHLTLTHGDLPEDDAATQAAGDDGTRP
jgi:hypothetical protein